MADVARVRDLTEYSSKSTDVKVRIGSKRTKVGMVGIGQNSKRREGGMVKMSRDICQIWLLQCIVACTTAMILYVLKSHDAGHVL